MRAHAHTHLCLEDGDGLQLLLLLEDLLLHFVNVLLLVDQGLLRRLQPVVQILQNRARHRLRLRWEVGKCTTVRSDGTS